ncbi:hypothetical protein HX109_15350 [Galbibacter sp. BG1]|uniref:hypothetical protein n=1 Tax=Galbibacter sp. BG1 TaxID=1170699 RepID=UPI0015C1C317|nr:hypothetical protein [Galbibacter sp. BG1]QLE02875.1 hypothetical protein HX109_15350 [Galbibacter sp. BG1]
MALNKYRITYGTTYLGTKNFNVGQKIELLNPFINLSLVPGNRPLLDPYPTTVGGQSFNYIGPNGVFKKADGTYVLLVNVVFGAHASRDIYYCTSPDLENWTFPDIKLLDTSTISGAQNPGNVFSVGNPYKLSNGNWLFLCGIQRTNGNYSGGYFVLNDSLSIVTAPTYLNFDGWNSTSKNYFPLALTYYNGRFRMFIHDRADNVDLNKSSIEYTWAVTESDSNLINCLNGTTTYSNKATVFDANVDSNFLRGKVDDIAYVDDGNELNIIFGSEEEPNSGWVTSNNREYGLASSPGTGSSWGFDTRSPLIITPMQFFRKYPELDFWWDHIGGFISPIRKGNHLYIFFAAGDDNPDYWLAGMKIPIS